MSTVTGPGPAATGAAATVAKSDRRLRFWEVDALRGVAVLMMVVYHLMWDLWYFQALTDAEFWNPFWKYWQRATASTFLILVGVSLTLVYRRQPAPRYRPFLQRGFFIFSLGLLVTLVMSFTGIGVVDFGILHLIGFSILAAYPLLRYTWLNLGLWLVFFIIGGVVQEVSRGESAWALHPFLTQNMVFSWGRGRWLAPLGIAPPGYAAVDFFPLFPWFGVVLLGVCLGNWFYTAKGRRFALPAWGNLSPLLALQVLGRNSLPLYLLHQPLLIAVLYLLGIGRF